jgi:hypothetical protein
MKSSDLAPSDYFLFRKLKIHLHGWGSSNDDEFKRCHFTVVMEQDKDFCFSGISSLSTKQRKYIELKETILRNGENILALLQQLHG